MKKKYYKNLSIWILVIALALQNQALSQTPLFLDHKGSLTLTERGASFLSSLPLRCLEKQFPYKTGITFLDSSLTGNPKNYHPAFYGCYDWHSSVHGHWMLVKLVKQFPLLAEATSIKKRLAENLSAANINRELLIFKADNLSFERIYGWGWLLYLQQELITWDDPLGKELSSNLKPLADFFSGSWIKFLNKLAYPIRVGEHTNLAFGLTLSFDYAVAANDTLLKNVIKQTALRFYLPDMACPIKWEPGGYDFLSPCLEEARLMSRVMPEQQYIGWLKKFLPELFSNPADFLKIAVVKDRTDAKLVHLDGLNFSRSWSLFEIAQKLSSQPKEMVMRLAKTHVMNALPNVVSGSYSGEHWLASFAVYALSKTSK